MITVGHRLQFVPTGAEIPAPRADTTTVVLDIAWTADPATGRPDVVAVRPVISAVLRDEDLFAGALTRLDAWAAAAGLPDRTVVDGVSHWFGARERSWHRLHEAIIWRRVIGRLAGGRPLEAIEVPPGHEVLAAVARAIVPGPGDGAAEEPDPGAGARPAAVAGGDRTLDAPRHLLRRILGRDRASEPGPDDRDRTTLLDARIAAIRGSGADRILVLTNASIRQQVQTRDGARSVDPNLGAVIDRLVAEGRPPIVLAFGLDHRDPTDWPAIEEDDHLLPSSLLLTRWRDPGERSAPAAHLPVDAFEAAADVPLDVDGIDLGPVVLSELRAGLEAAVAAMGRQAGRIDRFLDEARPAAILLSHEGMRTAWIVAAERLGIPVFAVQHGVLYPTHPGYRHPRHPGLHLPTCTFVYGEYERRVLEGYGGYRADEVEVTGSPRLELDRGIAEPASAEGERAAVRRELGVADGDVLLVVSTVHVPLIRWYLANMLEALLGGPLPGVHVVVKQHPGETDEGPYRALLEGLARAGGYAPPPITVVQRIDLYRLLRASDAHLGFLSTVLTDAVVVGTPNLISRAQASGDLLGYVAAGVATPVATVADLRAALADPRPPEPEARRAFLDEHFRPGDATGRILAAIAARGALSPDRATRGPVDAADPVPAPGAVEAGRPES
jgi:hypothetical protein